MFEMMSCRKNVSNYNIMFVIKIKIYLLYRYAPKHNPVSGSRVKHAHCTHPLCPWLKIQGFCAIVKKTAFFSKALSSDIACRRKFNKRALFINIILIITPARATVTFARIIHCLEVIFSYKWQGSMVSGKKYGCTD